MQDNYVWIFVITVALICFIVLCRHGVEIVFNAYDTNYEFGLFVVVFGHLRIMEIKKLNLKNFKKKAKKKKKPHVDLGFLKYINAKIDIDYSIATVKLNPEYAQLCAVFCSLLECVDTSTSLQVTQHITYQYFGVNIKLKLRVSIFNVIYALIIHKINQKSYV